MEAKYTHDSHKKGNGKDQEKVRRSLVLQSFLLQFLEEEWQELLSTIRQTDAECWIVTDEVGLGIVPETRLGRFFRDVQGKINQLIAKEASEAYLVICGLAQQLK